jgi:NitT/TauT family transport system permease protein
VTTSVERVEAGPRPAERRSWRPGRRGIVALRVALGLALVAAWEFLSGTPGDPGVVFDEYYTSSPSAVWDAWGRWIAQDLLWQSILVTAQEALLGFGLGAAIGLAAGLLLGINGTLAAVLSPFVSAVYSIPRLALVPLFMLWFGIGLASKVALVSSIVAFLVFYSTFAGVKDVDRELVDKMRLMRARPWQVHLKVTVPSAMVFIISGLNISAPYALVAAVTAEMLGSNRGMGYLLINSSGQFYTAGVFAAIVVMMGMGLVLMGLVRLAERRLLRWKQAGARG